MWLGRGKSLRLAFVAAGLGALVGSSFGLGRYPFDKPLPAGIRNAVVRVTAPNANPNLVT